MPTVSVTRRHFYEKYGEELTDDAFEELCFEYGIELDEVTTEKAIIRKEKHLNDQATEDEELIYKIDVPANRYDLLCAEGISRSLRIFKGVEEVPKFTLTSPCQAVTMTVKPETALIRPFVVCAILRGMTFDTVTYNSFIELQDKLHQNICRKRTLVAIGTHDLDTLEGPFTYEALPPEDIKFVPLKQTNEFNAKDLLEFYKSDSKLKHYLHIIENSPVFPVLYDNKRRVLSLPPVINGAHSAISLNTKNVLIECTATDLTKAKIVLNTMVTMFSEYCANKFAVEPVVVVHHRDGKAIYPDLSIRTLDVSLSYIQKTVGIQIPSEKVASMLTRMQLAAELVEDGNTIRVSIPPTRSDILHPCDVMEDVAIAHGYNNIPAVPPKTYTQGKEQPLNEFSDSLRQQLAMAGFTEVLNWILLSRAENSNLLNREHDDTVVVVANPRSSEFEVLRTSLLPGILKVMKHSKDVPLPVKIFEVSDIVRLDSTKEVGATNRRHLAALYSSKKSGFEIIHGLLDMLMDALAVSDYHLEPSKEPEFLEGRQAAVFYKATCVGKFGIIHPEVLKNFDIPDPCSFLELDVEHFL